MYNVPVSTDKPLTLTMTLEEAHQLGDALSTSMIALAEVRDATRKDDPVSSGLCHARLAALVPVMEQLLKIVVENSKSRKPITKDEIREAVQSMLPRGHLN